MRNLYAIIGLIVIILVIIVFSIVRNKLPQLPKPGSTPTPTVVAENQPAVSVSKHTPARTAVVDSVILSKPGFAVVHEDNNGQPGAVLGSSDLLTAGRHDNVIVPLSRKTNDGEILLVVVHDDNGDGKFDASSDQPTSNNGQVVMKNFSVANVTSQSGGTQSPATGLGEDDDENVGF